MNELTANNSTDSSEVQFIEEGILLRRDAYGKSLPPKGKLILRDLSVGQKVQVHWDSGLGCWLEGHIIMRAKFLEDYFKISILIGKDIHYRVVSLDEIAYHHVAPVIIPIGTKVISLFRNNWQVGIVVEVPKKTNDFRYLVYHDDYWLHYVCHENVRVVCQQKSTIWHGINLKITKSVQRCLKAYSKANLPAVKKDQKKCPLQGLWLYRTVKEFNGMDDNIILRGTNPELVYSDSSDFQPMFIEVSFENV